MMQESASNKRCLMTSGSGWHGTRPPFGRPPHRRPPHRRPLHKPLHRLPPHGRLPSTDPSHAAEREVCGLADADGHVERQV
jgi:hypothetical protein